MIPLRVSSEGKETGEEDPSPRIPLEDPYRPPTTTMSRTSPTMTVTTVPGPNDLKDVPHPVQVTVFITGGLPFTLLILRNTLRPCRSVSLRGHRWRTVPHRARQRRKETRGERSASRRPGTDGGRLETPRTCIIRSV